MISMMLRPVFPPRRGVTSRRWMVRKLSSEPWMLCGGDGICGSGDEYDVSGYGGGDGNGNVAATAAISASVDAAI
ncbi:hypothetical protein Tco_0654674 [Tanacetum coccineum]|uniref:Uncharacterized protein n=1 Tax=Tanacetum coccineum TaxID=301880 RepID=A0ABQ4X4T4_9ASTR